MRKYLLPVLALILVAALGWAGALAVAPAGPATALAATARHAAVAGDTTIYACITSTRQFTRVTTGTPAPCPSGATPVSWPGTAAQPSPSPSPTSTSPSPSPTGTSPSPSPAPTSPSPTPTSPSPSPTGTFSCVTSADLGFCPGPGVDYFYPPDQLSNGSNLYLNNNMFAHKDLPSATQILSANSPGDWQVTADMNGTTGEVISGPQSRTDLAAAPVPLSLFTQLTSSLTEDMHPQAGTGAEAGYDIWSSTTASSLFAQEMMIWTDTVNRGTCGGATPVASGVSFGGANGVPARSWNLCRNGPAGPSSEMIWYLTGTQQQSGSVDILAMITYLTAHGYYPAGTGITQVDQGFEICSTGGQPETFAVSQFGITAS